ncbi:MAG: type II toxin-antitoxin system Phd/YefM family antitoxin [Balneolales bacterium]|nr:type II toxin-antitoxin system Phd/YefM family antitoxin [Balneolales bacterium]
MQALQVDRDIQSLSEFRANAASFIQRVKTDRRPLILTQHGKSSAVLMDVEDYQNLLNTVTLLREVATAREELNKGEEISNQELFADLKSKYTKR